jgi:hypothetical protein
MSEEVSESSEAVACCSCFTAERFGGMELLLHRNNINKKRPAHAFGLFKL